MSDIHPSYFSRLWLAETVRLREAHWGPLDDAQAVRDARRGPEDLDARIVLRAEALGRAEGLADRLAQWRSAALGVLALLAIIAVVSGGLAAAGALGDGLRPVNVIWALGALLGVHLLTFVVWLLGLMWPAGSRPRGLGAIWLWATRKLARGPQGGLAPTAFVNLLAQARARGAFFGLVSHGLWSLALTAALITLIVLLSTAQYRFVWATTLLAPERFVDLARGLGAIPAMLGFSVPDADTVRASDGRSVLGAAAQTQWSIWLLGVCTVFGLMPRLVALAGCGWRVRRALSTLKLDTALPGYSALRDRLLPPAQAIGIDRPAGPLHAPHIGAAPALNRTAGQAVIASLELAPDIAWPPPGLSEAVVNAGALDDRVQRRQLLDGLSAAPARRLLLVCDARQTPDRGTIGLVVDLARYTAVLRVALASAADRHADRASIWVERLVAAGLAHENIEPNLPRAVQWIGASPAQETTP